MMVRAPLLSGADQGEWRSEDRFSLLGSTHVGGTGGRALTWFDIEGSLFRGELRGSRITPDT